MFITYFPLPRGPSCGMEHFRVASPWIRPGLSMGQHRCNSARHLPTTAGNKFLQASAVSCRLLHGLSGG
eukprot:8280464-Alexandrium_andersonii.AAC.1